MTTANARDPAFAGGAFGDGVSNDTAAITAAITALPAGSTLYLGPGTFMSDTINVGKSLNIVGAGPGVTTLKNRGTGGQHLLWVRADNVNVSGMTIDGNRPAQTVNTGSAMVCGEAATEYKNFTLHNCEIKSNGFECISILRVNGFRVTDNYIWDTWDTGCDMLENARNGVVANNLFVSGGRYAIAFDAPTLAACANITIQDNTIRLLGTGVANAGGGTVAMLWGIVMLNVDGVSIQGNTIDCSAGACFGGIRAQGQGSNGAIRVSIKDNIVKGGASATDSGISLDGTIVQAMRAQIEGNVVKDFTGSNIAGIQNTVGQKAAIRGNVVSNCNRGINLEKGSGKNITENIVSDNIVEGCTIGMRFGIGSGGTGEAIVKDNWVTGSSSFNYAVDSGWTLHKEGPPWTSTTIDSTAVLEAATVASASTITVPGTAKVLSVTGTTNITTMTAGYDGQRVTLVFTGILTFTDGSNLKLNGNLVTTADDTITLVSFGGNWYEEARSVN